MFINMIYFWLAILALGWLSFGIACSSLEGWEGFWDWVGYTITGAGIIGISYIIVYVLDFLIGVVS